MSSFTNPALLANQPRAWEAGFSNQTGFAMGEDVWAAAGGWASPRRGVLSYGSAVMVSGAPALEDVEELDISGNPTGTRVSANGTQIGVAGMVQYGIVSAGLGLRYARESLDGLPDATGSRNGLGLDAGVAAAVGYLDLSAALCGIALSGDPATTVRGGIGWRFDAWWFDASLGVSAAFPVGNRLPTFWRVIGGGISWNLHKAFTLHIGERGWMKDPPDPRIGFTARMKGYSLDYTLCFTRVGADHLFALNYSFGEIRESSLEDNWDRITKARQAARGAASPGVADATHSAASAAPAFGAATGERTLAVGSFESQGVSASDAAVVSDLFRNEMVQGRVFKVVEKANMERVLQEQAFQQTGCTTSECAVKLGKILNVRYLVLGSFGKLVGQYVINVRVVDVETAAVVYSDVSQIADPGQLSAGVKVLADRLTAAIEKAK